VALVPEFEKQTGHKVTVDNAPPATEEAYRGWRSFDSRDDARRGRRTDRRGKLAAGSRVMLASVGIGVVVKEGAAQTRCEHLEKFSSTAGGRSRSPISTRPAAARAASISINCWRNSALPIRFAPKRSLKRRPCG